MDAQPKIQTKQHTHSHSHTHTSTHQSTSQKYPQSHLYYLKGIQLNKPQILMKMQTSHMMILFFYIGGLHILQKQHMLNEKNMRQKLIEYILSLQLRNGGFTSSTLYSKFPKQSKYQQGHIVFTYSAVNCLKILGALDRVDKNKILESIKKHQKLDGSFSSFQNSTQCDLRFTYSALSICKLFEDFTQINIENAKKYIDSCYNFDGGYGLRPRDQSHSGAIFCAIASYQHLGIEMDLKRKLKTIGFLVKRQTACDQQPSLIGIQGRVGKSADTCYCFWAGASLKILSGQNLLNSEIQKFIMKCYKNQQKTFSKFISSSSGDPVHTFHSITGLKILFNQSNYIQLSQLLCKKLLNLQQK